tara:strand:- start:587 stop:742 length:156 start_codon:yes stop_codon:yes gene_type:complete
MKAWKHKDAVTLGAENRFGFAQIFCDRQIVDGRSEQHHIIAADRPLGRLPL